MSSHVAPRRQAIAIRNARSPRLANEECLSPGEALRFRAIIQSTIDSLQIAQTLHKPNVNTGAMTQWNHDHPSPDRLQSVHRNKTSSPTTVAADEMITFPLIDRQAQRQTYLRDARMIDTHFVRMIDLLTRTQTELQESQSWSVLKEMVDRRVESKKETEDLLLEICDLIEQKKKCESERIDEKREFKKQEASMMRDIEVLEKRCSALRNDSKQNLEYEHSLCSAQRSSLKTLYEDEIGGAKKENDLLSKQMNDEKIIHKFCEEFLDQQHQFVVRKMEDRTKEEKEDIESADRMIFQLQQSLDALKDEYQVVSGKVTAYQLEEKREAKRLMEQQQKELEMERTKQITAHVFNKIIDGFSQKKTKTAVKKKGKKGKKKKKKK